jgi:MinD-like ATPase involved in chromosome partitioning or flagellar assembly
VDLPTYTNIWRIEKRLYKLYDLRLPMPLPLVQIGVFFGIFVPWIILLQLMRVPFHTPWHVVYIVPPGVLTWLATRPVIEGKRLTELMISQVRYLSEAKTWARLTPIREPDEVVIVGRVWLRRRGVSGQVHAGRQAARTAQASIDAAAPAEQSAPPLHDISPVRPAAAAHATEAPPRRPAAPARAPLTSLRPTPHDGTATVSPAAPPGFSASPTKRGGRRPGDPGNPPRSAGPWATPVGEPNVTRADNPRLKGTGDPNVTRADNPRVKGTDDPNATRVDSDDPRVVRRDQAPPAPQRVRGFPVPPSRPADGGAQDAGEEAERRERPAAHTMDVEPATPGPAAPGTSHRPGRQRSTSHEPERPAATAGPHTTGPSQGTDPFGSRGAPPAPGRTRTSSTRSSESSGSAETRAPSGSGRPGAPSAPGRPAERADLERSHGPWSLGRPSEPSAPGRPGTSSGSGPSGGARPAEPGSPPRTTPSRPVEPDATGGRHVASTRPSPESTAEGDQTERRPDESAPRSTDTEQTDEGTPTAPVIRLVAGGRHATPGTGPTPAAHEPPTTPERDREKSPSTAETTAEGVAAPKGHDAIAQVRTDQIVWPARTPREAASPAGADEAQDAGSPKPLSQGPPPGPFARPGGQARGRSHGDNPSVAREGRQPPPASAPPPVRKPADKPVGSPAQRPVPPRPSAPPKAPAAGLTTPAQVPLPPSADPQRAAPARPSTPPARARQGWTDPSAAPSESPARGVRSGPASPVRPGPLPQGGQETEGRDDESRGLRRIFSGGGHGDADYEQRVRTAFEGARRVVVLGCTGGAGQTVTGLMLGHTFAQHRGDRIVAVDVNPGPGAMARRTRAETRETLTSLITHAEQVTGYQVMRRYTSISKSGLEVVAAGKNPVQALDDRDYALAMRTLDRFYSITLLDAAAAVVARVLPYADQIVLVAPASSDASRAVAMTFEWLDGHGYEDLRSKAVTVINGVSRRSMDDVEQAESVARGRCRALVRIPWDDHLSLDRAPRNELRTLRASTRKAYIALGGVVAGGLVQIPDRYPRQEVSR